MAKPSLTQRNEIFNQQVENSVVQSRYDLTARSVGTFRMGVLYPIYCRNDIHPGDMWQMSAAPFVRFMPLVSPSLTNVDVELRFFFVPRRILFSLWKNFISPSSADDVNVAEPVIYNFEENPGLKKQWIYNVAGSIYDYMGCSSIPWTKTGGTNNVYGTQGWKNVQTGHSASPFGYGCPIKDVSSYIGAANLTVPIEYSAYPFLAYNAIWNEYFRDENLQDEALAHVTTGGNHHGYDFYLRRVNWEKDYFAGGLPFVTQSIFSTPTVNDGDTIEQLREASALTKWLELQAIGGHRYQESILSHFGVRVPDEAAQIPVYLGGGKCPVQIGSVEQTSPVEFSPLATLGGKGTASDSMFIDKMMFKEHGTVLGLMYIRPKALYADVTPRDLLAKKSRHDYYWPTFANLGDEAVEVEELNPGWCKLHNTGDTFNYQMRYASMRTSFDEVHGQLRPLETLESWTQARSWSDVSAGDLAPDLEIDGINSDFITCDPSNRIFAITENADNLVGEITTFVDAIRPLPSYVNPKLD